MKNFKLAAIVLLASVTTILSSCSKSDPTPAAPPAATTPAGAYITCKVDGADFTTLGGAASNVNARK